MPGLTPVADDGRGVLDSAAAAPVAFDVVDRLWHDWRAGSFGDVALADVVRAQSATSAGLREAIESFPDAGADHFYPEWRTALRWEKPGRPPPDEQWKAEKRRGAVAAELRKAATSLRAERAASSSGAARASEGESSDGAAPGFALVFVPSVWADSLESIARRLERAIGWPEAAPLVAVLAEGSCLSLAAAFFPPSSRKPPPRAFFLGPREFEEVGAEGYRLQEQLDIGNMYYTKYWRKYGRTNGTVVAARMMFERRATDVRSMLVFVDPAAPSEFPRQAIGLLDSSYPKAVKAGVVAAASDESPGRSIFVGGRFGGLRQGGVVGVMLPGGADSAVSLCGCEAVGPMWEVFDADSSVGASVIRTIADPESTNRDPDGRIVGYPAGGAMQELVGEGEDVWVGVPRDSKRLAKRAAPGAGEWALFRGRALLATGALLLEGPGPGAEGVSGLGRLKARPITRAQCFKTVVNHEALGRLSMTYKMEWLASLAVSEGEGSPTAQRPSPFATLVVAGGPGPRASILDEGLFGGVCLGVAVLGPPGTLVQGPEPFASTDEEEEALEAEADNAQPDKPTLIHRQAVGLLMLYAPD